MKIKSKSKEHFSNFIPYYCSMKDLNGIQSLSVVGIIFSIFVQITLLCIDKHIPNIWALYPSWAFIFFIGYLVKKFGNDDEDHVH